MIELTQDQERQMRLPDQQSMVQEALLFYQHKLPSIHQKLGHGILASRLNEGYAVAIEVGLSKRELVFKYMLYSVSMPVLRDASRVKKHFQETPDRPDLVAQDLFALLAFRPANPNAGRH
ncbi:hypothetical protein [Halomonas huangheensis]|uniref:Uncharacterized protein n=1 Tax=Halomonas huangheensis TaxID=1178482 RepID=W1NAU2_9GAMM|nr:hypothetical protein [Halomonas huangheensis]ALM52430.1 hypothetical protein AR456_09155 [Halomonas huangheensis]ERL52649.1 hypothetical protein BJB45_18900 [Halomonas huangheensis]